MRLPRTRLCFLLCLGVLGLAWASAFRAGEDPPPRGKLGEKIADFSLKDAAGKSLALRGLKGKKAIVVVFLSFECPVSAGYAPTLAELAKSHRDVAFLGVSVGEEDAAQVEKLAREFELPFPVYRDEKRAAASALRAEVSPEAFVLDADFVLRYRGRIDDRYAARLKPNARVSRHDLRQALDEVLAGKAVTESATRAVGCPIPGTRPTPSTTGKVTYYRDVLPILQEHCQACHRPGDVGPFSLMTYRQAVNWAGDIKEYTRDRKMPPWKPVDGVAFHGERKLSDREIATLAEWVDGGTPEGDPKDAPAAKKFHDGWQLGKPDLELTVDDDFVLGASGPDLYRCFVLPTGLTKDQTVTAVDVRPGNRRVVHHAVLFVDTARAGRKLEAAEHKNPGKDDRGPGYALPLSLSFLPGFLPYSGMGGWIPGLTPRYLPEGTGFHLPRGADLVLQLHYHRNGRVEKDRTTVGLYFAKKPAPHQLQGVVVPAHFVYLPAGAERYRVTGTTWIRQDCRLHTVVPHMHLLGREIKVTMTPPGGKPRTLIVINDWDFNWQEEYFLKEPLAVKAGTRFDVEGVFDNSARNPRNWNSPPRRVFFGLATTDEMCLAALAMTPDKPGILRYDVQPRLPQLDWALPWALPLIGI
jgi:peroxiredoxin